MRPGAPTATSLRRPGRLPLVIGHRGASSIVPENTLPAFRAAFAAGAHWVEADVQPTADGVPVILHDADLDRTTTGSGPVRAQRWAAVSALQIRGLPGTGVPTLGDLLGLLAADRSLLLEIKGRHTAAQLGALLQACAAGGWDERVYLQSFEVDVLALLRELAPGRPFGLLVEQLDDDPVGRCRALGAAAYNPPVRAVLDRPDLVARLRAAGPAVAVWTSDDPAEWARLTAAGVDAIITNTPADLLAWQRGSGGPPSRP